MTTVPSLPVFAQHAALLQQLVVTQVAQQLLSVLPQTLAPGLAHQLHCLILGPQDIIFTQEGAILVHIFSSYQTSEPPPQSIPNFNLSVFLSCSQSSIFEGDRCPWFVLKYNFCLKHHYHNSYLSQSHRLLLLIIYCYTQVKDSA